MSEWVPCGRTLRFFLGIVLRVLVHAQQKVVERCLLSDLARRAEVRSGETHGGAEPRIVRNRDAWVAFDNPQRILRVRWLIAHVAQDGESAGPERVLG